MAERVDAHFAPAAALSGTIAAPPDKSISHRAALLGAFGEGDPLSAANRLMGSRSIDVWHERAA